MMGLFGMGGGGGGGNSCHRAIVSTPATAESGCPRGDGVPGRASRDADWRAHLGEGMKTLSAKLAEAAAATTGGGDEGGAGCGSYAPGRAGVPPTSSSFS